MPDDLQLEIRGSVAWLFLNRPEKRNAISLDMWQALPGMVDRIERDDGLRGLVIRGAGTDAFSAGADVGEFERLRSTPQAAAAYNDAVEQAETALAGMSKPTVAMVRGPCIGGGCGIALCCDVRFCDATATFGITAASLGIVYALAPTKRLVDIVGPARAKYMLFSARKIDAAQALAIGLVDEVFASGDLEAATEDFSGTVASKAQLSVRATKRIVGLILDGQVDDDENTRQLRAASFDSDDYREGVRAFLEKNTPHFT